MINEYKWCRYQKERMGPLQLASLSIPRKHAKTHSMLRFFEVSTVKMSSNHAKSCNFSVRKLGAQPDGPGVTWSGLQAWTPWRQIQVLSAEIHRNPWPNLPWCQPPEPFSPQCTKLSGPWSSQFGERCCISKTCTAAQFKVCPVSIDNKPEHTGRRFTHV